MLFLLVEEVLLQVLCFSKFPFSRSTPSYGGQRILEEASSFPEKASLRVVTMSVLYSSHISLRSGTLSRLVGAPHPPWPGQTVPGAMGRVLRPGWGPLLMG